MIRSLVAHRKVATEDFTIRRNLERDDLERAIQDESLVWIDIVDSDAEELRWLAAVFQLSPAVVKDLQRDDRRPTLLVYPDYLFLSLFEPHLTLDRVAGREIHCVVTDTCFITVRAADTDAVADAYNRMTQSAEVWQSGIAYCLYLTAQYVTDTYYPLLDRISGHLSRLEETLLDGVINDYDRQTRKTIYRAKQQLIGLRQMVAPQREVFSNVIGEKRLNGGSNTLELFRHLYERLLRVYDVIDSQRDLSSNVLDMVQNQEARRLVAVVNRLTILSMIFLPLTFLTGLFELNFATTSEPFILPIHGGILFVSVIAAMMVSAGAMTFFFKKRRWI